MKKRQFFFVGPMGRDRGVPIREVTQAEFDEGNAAHAVGVEVTHLRYGGFRMRVDTWFGKGGFAEVSMSHLKLPAALRSFWAMCERAELEDAEETAAAAFRRMN